MAETVTVETDGDDGPDVVDTSTTVVVPESGNTDATVELATQVGQLQEQVANAEEHAEEAETQAVIAQETASVALDVAISKPEPEPIIVEEPEPEPEPDTPPEKTHWLHRPLSEWRNR